MLAKSVKVTSFSESYSYVSQPLELICLDAWEPSLVPSINGYCYYILFYGHYNKYCWTYFLKQKFEVSNKFIKFQHI